MPVAEVSTVEELRTLDDALCVAGYMAGQKNDPDYSQRDKAYWHGYLNGMVDGGHAKTSSAQQMLAREVVASGYLSEMFTPLQSKG